MDATRILGRSEIATVLDDLKHRAKRSQNSFQNLIIFRLSCCCGLRVKEICGLNVGDFIVTGPRPCIRIRKAITKGELDKRRARKVPLWWDAGTLRDLTEWLEIRQKEGPDAPYIAAMRKGHRGYRLETDKVADRWKTAIKSLGAERQSQLSIHCGRHSFCSHAITNGRSLIEVRDAAGHKSINTTSLYLHSLERTGLPDVFSFDKE